jgi:type II secretory pathway pseudopilin PulG
MLVLIVIMAVLSTVVVPAFSRLRDRAVFETHVGRVTSFLTQARAQAIELGTEVEVRFDPQTETFSARADSAVAGEDLPTALANIPDAATTVYDQTLALPEDYRILEVEVFGPDALAGELASGRETVLYFREDGTCDGLRFTVLRENRYAVVVTLWPATASVDVEPAANR